MEEVAQSSGFSRQLRIRKSSEYQRHRNRSRAFRTRNFVIAWAATERENSRLGLTVSRKVGKAHDRNRIKRFVRTWFRHNWRLLPGSFDLVVIARPGAAQLDSVQVEGQLQQCADWLISKSGERR